MNGCDAAWVTSRDAVRVTSRDAAWVIGLAMRLP